MTQNQLLILVSALAALAIFLWLVRDMRKQSRWREEKQAKIDRLRQKIADKERAAKQADPDKDIDL